jgi:phosphomannomutase
MVAVEGNNLSELARRLYARYGTLLSRRVQLPWRERTRVALERLAGRKFTSLAGQPVSRVDRSDGVLLELADGGWVLVRQSGTEKKLRIYAEGASSRQLRTLVSEARRLVRAAEEGA